MKKYPKIKRLGHRDNNGILSNGPVTILEKMDGANFRFTLQRNTEYHQPDRDLVFGSRNVVYKYDCDIASAFQHAVDYVRDAVDVEKLKTLDERQGPLVFYGEAMHSHTLDYEWDETPNFLGFDIWDSEQEGFLSGGAMRNFYEKLGLETVPRLHFGDPQDFDLDDVPDSKYRDGVAEGFVIQNYRTQQRAKVRSERFKELHGTPQGNTPESYEPSDSERLAHKFTTEARVIKQVQKMANEGYEVEMGMMDDLWSRVFEDIIEEEYDTIFLGNHEIDTKQFRSEVASITANHLETYLHRPEDSVLNPDASMNQTAKN